jgi:hypothetical protein
MTEDQVHLAHRPTQAARQLHEDDVPGPVTMMVVDRLEVVEVQHEHAE